MKLLSATIVCMLLVITTGQPLFAAPPVQTLPPAQVRVLEDANLRAGPGTTFAVVGGAQPATTLAVAACNSTCDWYLLDTGQWIAAFLVEAIAAEEAAPEPAAAVEPAAVAVSPTINAVQANLRRGPGTDYAIVGSAKLGDAVVIVARNDAGDWCETADGAWVAAFLVDRIPAGLPVSDAEFTSEPDINTPAVEITYSVADLSENPAVVAYANEVIAALLIYTTASAGIEDLMVRASEDPYLLFDAGWKVELAFNMGLILGANQNLREMVVPASMAGIHQRLLQAADHLDRGLYSMDEGISNLDVTALTNSIAEIDAATEDLDAVAAITTAYSE